MDLKKYIRSIQDYPKKGILFRDITTLIKNKDAYRDCIDQMSKILSKVNYDKIAGIESRGFIFASPLSYNLSKPYVLLRKKNKLPAERYSVDFELEYGKATLEIHKDSIKPKEKVLIIDDLVATGGTAEAGAKLVEKSGGIVSGFIFVMNLFDLGGKKLGVTDIISVSAVGSLKENLDPGTFVLVDQFIDRTFARKKTFFDEEIVAHVSMAHPTSQGLSNACENAIKQLKIKYQSGGTYVVMEGPQFSTLAESNLYRSWNADVIGMTNMPEAKLAREAEIRYITVAMVTDFDCWHPDHENVDVQMVIKTLMKNAENAKNMIKLVIENFESKIMSNDPANNCLDTAIITNPKLMTKKTKNKLKNIAGRVLFKK